MLNLPEIHVFFSFLNKNTEPACMSHLQDYLKALDKNSGGINHPATHLSLVKYHDCLGKELQADRFINQVAKKEVTEMNKNGALSMVPVHMGDFDVYHQK
jgi:hypothetical protein